MITPIVMPISCPPGAGCVVSPSIAQAIRGEQEVFIMHVVVSSERPRTFAATYAPAAAALAYPVLLDACFVALDVSRRAAHGGAFVLGSLAAIFLGLAALVPVVAFTVARDLGREHAASEADAITRRLAHLAFASPALYTGLGVALAVVRAPLAPLTAWTVLWSAALARASFARTAAGSLRAVAPAPRWVRFAHGGAATVLVAFLGAHFANHLVGLAGPGAHGRVMATLRTVYRHPIVEPILLGLFVFQAVSGLALARPRSLRSTDGWGVLQTMSGSFLAFFVVSHATAVLVLGRAVLHVDTDWSFATGGPAGLLGAATNVHLVPYYAMAVFTAITHAGLGLRGVLLEHHVAVRRADLSALAFCVLGALVSLVTILAMVGLRAPRWG